MSEYLAALRGTLYGSSRSVLISEARKSATAYFGTGCVQVRLENERPHLSGFNAEMTAIVWHDLEHRTYGPAVCRNCKQDSWPHSPLNAASKKEWQ